MTSTTRASDMLARMLANMAGNHTDLKISPQEEGQINGLPFSRGYWKGKGVKTGKVFHGSFYVSIVAPEMIVIQGHDVEPYSKTTMLLLDAATCTLQKR